MNVEGSWKSRSASVARPDKSLAIGCPPRWCKRLIVADFRARVTLQLTQWWRSHVVAALQSPFAVRGSGAKSCHPAMTGRGWSAFVGAPAAGAGRLLALVYGRLI